MSPSACLSVVQYATEWLQRPCALRLSTSLPLQRGVQHGKSLFGAIQVAVDRWGRVLIERAVRKVMAPSRIGILITCSPWTTRPASGIALPINTEGRFLPRQAASSAMVGVSALLRATDAIHGETETAQDLRFLLGTRLTLGGARPRRPSTCQ